MSNIPAFSLQSEFLVEIGNFHVTNAVAASFVTSVFVVILAIFATRKASLVPTRMQLFLEVVLEFFADMLKAAFGSEARGRKYLPYIVTLFLFLMIANQFSTLPVLASLKAGNGALFRTSPSDWSQTIALAIVSLGVAHLIALSAAPIKHLGNFIKLGSFFKIRKVSDLGNALLEFFLGLLDIIGEIAKLISMSARLFGNIFSGEVLVVVIAGISVYTQFLVPIPFIGLSIFSGFVQAFVFTLLSLQFMAATVTSVDSSDH